MCVFDRECVSGMLIRICVYMNITDRLTGCNLFLHRHTHFAGACFSFYYHDDSDGQWLQLRVCLCK